jgi:hypothetical protein
MEITVALIITAITLLLGQITKATPIPNKYIPLQNIVIAVVSAVICIICKVENMGVLETIITCIFGTMSAGGIVDIKDVVKKKK